MSKKIPARNAVAGIRTTRGKGGEPRIRLCGPNLVLAAGFDACMSGVPSGTLIELRQYCYYRKSCWRPALISGILRVIESWAQRSCIRNHQQESGPRYAPGFALRGMTPGRLLLGAAPTWGRTIDPSFYILFRGWNPQERPPHNPPSS